MELISERSRPERRLWRTPTGCGSSELSFGLWYAFIVMKGSTGAKGLPLAPTSLIPSRFSIVRLLLEVSFARLLVTLTSVISPVHFLFKWQLLCARVFWQLCRTLERASLRGVGWLASPVRSRLLRQVLSFISPQLRRWHVLSGERCLWACGCLNWRCGSFFIVTRLARELWGGPTAVGVLDPA